MASNEGNLPAEAQSNERIMKIARKKGYHDMFSTMDSV